MAERSVWHVAGIASRSVGRTSSRRGSGRTGSRYVFFHAAIRVTISVYQSAGETDAPKIGML